MGVQKLLNLVLKCYYKFTFTIQKSFLLFFSFNSDFLPSAQSKTVTTSTLANLAAKLDRNCSILTTFNTNTF